MSESNKPIEMSFTEQASVHTDASGVVNISTEGSMSSNIDQIKSFGIANIVSITDYQINNNGSLISHSIKFRNGGSIELSFNEDGTNFSATISEMSSQIHNGNEILIRSKL